MKLLLMTQNKHKVRECAQILGSDVSLKSVSEVFDTRLSVLEDGTTFEENATKKVMAYPKLSDWIYVAEDSGLLVSALDGAPGVQSARYAGEGASSEACCEKLLLNLEGVKDRSASFIAVMAVRFSDTDVRYVTGHVSGEIATDFSGASGFGYDPIFIPAGFDQSFASLGEGVKNDISHRSQALSALMTLLSL